VAHRGECTRPPTTNPSISMTVGIIGSGVVGQALGKGFASRGHAVRLGTREPERDELQQWAAETEGDAAVVPNEEAASSGDLLVLATGWSGTENAIRLAGPEHFRGKVVIDVTNPLDSSQGMPPRLALGHTDSGGEQVQRWLPGARVVKAFNIVNASLMVDPEIPGGPPTMFIASDDEAARGEVRAICEDFGWEVIDLGPMQMARYLEPLAMVWIAHAVRIGTWTHAFKMLYQG
jgi:8-hydroxy-5-deazaflavin:NADPH oxidoreductase